jgi:xanthine dehydrogenase iron-sulfur cluster and FAD-binding subunit A
MWTEYFNVATIDEALSLLAERGSRARIVAGATDLVLEIERGVRSGIDTLIDVSRLPGLDRIVLDEDETLHMGPLVTHNACVASKLIFERAYPLARAALEVGAPQIRNRGTVAGNLITASPANDTISPLMALGARLKLRSVRGERQVFLKDFYTGVRRTVMQPDEMLVDISFPAMKPNQKGTFVKLGLRRAQAISLVNAAVLLTLDGKRIQKAVITLGAVAPTIIHAQQAEAFLVGQELEETSIARAAELAMQAARPIDDVRSSADYRHEMVRVCTLRALRLLSRGAERKEFPARPVLLWGKDVNGHVPDASPGRVPDASPGSAPALPHVSRHAASDDVVTTINGREYRFSGVQDKTLLRLIREDAGLTGTKEGCAEGECGACEVFLDGVAVMSCLVPAARAHGATIVTIEGLAPEGGLHPVQQAFIQAGAVQCGYCTPGFVMSAAKLLEEQPHPTRDEIRQSISGNLCRCTGYYTIIEAIERAAQVSSSFD